MWLMWLMWLMWATAGWSAIHFGLGREQGESRGDGTAGVELAGARRYSLSACASGLTPLMNLLNPNSVGLNSPTGVTSA